MDTRARTLVKALTWQASGLVTMTAVGFVVTGSAGAGGSIALIGAGLGVVFYALHERVWARIHWGVGRADQPSSRPPTSSRRA